MCNQKELSSDCKVYLEIFEAILSCRLLPGTKLTEDSLATIFKVSRTVVRRALLRLSNDHIVEIKPNRGANVSRPSIKKAQEVLQARRLIEGELVKAVINVASEEDFEKLTQIAKSEQNRFESGNHGGVLRISGDFHMLLGEISGNETLSSILRQLAPQTSLIIAQYEKPGYKCCSHLEHFELIEVIKKGDTEAAVTLMDEHLQKIENKLLLQDSNSPTDLNQVFDHLN